MAKKIKDTDLYEQSLVLLYRKNKDQLQELTKKASLYSNTQINGSLLIRAMIDYFYENESRLKSLNKYIKKNKAENIAQEIEKLLAKGLTVEEIEKELDFKGLQETLKKKKKNL